MMKRIFLFFLAAILVLSLMPSARMEYRLLQKGDSGDDVLALKEAMRDLGYFKIQDLSDEFTDTTEKRIRFFQQNNHLQETGTADDYLQELIFSGKAAPAQGEFSLMPAPEGPEKMPLLPPLTKKHFLPEGSKEFVYEDSEDGRWIYISDSLSVEIKRLFDAEKHITWFETEIFASPQSPLTSYLTEGKTPGRRYAAPLSIAQKNHAVLAVTDDFFGYRWLKDQIPGIVIRNRQIITDQTYKADKKRLPNLEILAVFEDGSMKAFLSDAHTAEEYLAMGVTNTYAFGPILVTEGKMGPNMQKEDYYAYREPRCAVGMIEPFHYMILTVKGRTKDSKGVYLPWLAEKMMEKGVTEAVNLDGGNTVSLIFMGKLLNATGKNVRSVTSIIGFGQSETVNFNK